MYSTDMRLSSNKTRKDMQKDKFTRHTLINTISQKGIVLCIIMSIIMTGTGCSTGSTSSTEETKSFAGQVVPIDENNAEKAETEGSGTGDIDLVGTSTEVQDESALYGSSAAQDNPSVSDSSSATDTASASDTSSAAVPASSEGMGSDRSDDLTVAVTAPVAVTAAVTAEVPATPAVPATDEDSRTSAEDRDELVASLKAAIKLTNSLETYHIHTVTTITDATTTGETSSVTELGAHIVADDGEQVLLATGMVSAFERSYPIEFYFKDGVIYQNIAGVKRSKKSNIDSALRSVSGSLWYPSNESIDTISSYDAGNNMTRYLINIVSEDPSTRSYVETFVKADGYVDSQHFVTQTVTGDKAGSSSDKWVSYTFVEGDFMPVFPDFSAYVME